MQLAEQQALITIFMESAMAQRREDRLLVEQNTRDFEERKVQERRKEDEEFFAQLAVIDLVEFHQRLDGYDTAIVEALMDNEKALDVNRKQLEKLWGEAHTLPDGRKVFKTEDGKHVVDDSGSAVPPATIDPDAIPNRLPRWETWKTARDAERKLLQEREELHKFQKKVDAARDAVDKGGIKPDGLDALDADLKRAMPDAVRQKLAGQAPGLKPDEPQIAEPLLGSTLPKPGDSAGRRLPLPAL